MSRDIEQDRKGDRKRQAQVGRVVLFVYGRFEVVQNDAVNSAICYSYTRRATPIWKGPFYGLPYAPGLNGCIGELAPFRRIATQGVFLIKANDALWCLLSI